MLREKIPFKIHLSLDSQHKKKKNALIIILKEKGWEERIKEIKQFDMSPFWQGQKK